MSYAKLAREGQVAENTQPLTVHHSLQEDEIRYCDSMWPGMLVNFCAQHDGPHRMP